MNLNDTLAELYNFVKQSEYSRVAYSKEFENLYNKLYRETLIVDEVRSELSCPLQIFVELHNKAFIYDLEGRPLKILQVLADTVVVKRLPGEKLFLPLGDYKKSFWLRKDKRY